MERHFDFSDCLPNNSCALDLGCKTAALAGTISQERNVTHFGIDSNSNVMKLAQSVNPHGIFLKISIENLKREYPPEKFDGVYASCSLAHLDQSTHVGIYRDVFRALKPNGGFVMWGRGDLEEEQKAICDAGFTITQCIITKDARFVIRADKPLNV